jgi:hypothetical protein
MLTVLEIKKSIKKKKKNLFFSRHGGPFFRLGGPFFGLAVNCHSSNWSWKALHLDINVYLLEI